jgi:hypothetical protein
LETGALLRGIAWRVRPKPLPFPMGPAFERRSGDPIATLSREHDVLCRQACDPLEIAAVLEAAGVDDRRVRSEYQAAGVFEVAEQMWHRVPWRASPDGPRIDPWRLPLWRAQLRGLLYALPALLAAAVLGQVGAGAGHLVLFLATAMSIAAGQGLSVLGHILISRGQRRAASTLTVIALLASIAVTVGITAGFWSSGIPVKLGLVSGGQLIFVVSATMLMVNGSDRLLLGVIAPGVALVGFGLLGVPIDHLLRLRPGTVYLAAPAATVVAGAFVASLRLLGAREGERLRSALGRPELSIAAIAGLYGLGLSAMVSFAVVAVVLGWVAEPTSRIVAATLPMTATFGMAEYLLHRARSRSMAGLGRAHLVTGFSRRSLTELRSMVGLHAVTAAVVAVAVMFVLGRGRPDAALTCYIAGYAVLSVALLLSTTLMSLGYVELAAAQVLGGAAALLLIGVLPQLRGAALAETQLGVLVAMFLVGYRLTVSRFTTASAHR